MSKLAALFPLFTMSDLQEWMPPALKVNATSLKKEVEKSGCYRNVLGSIVFTQKDIEGFLNWLRAEPSALEAQARLGAGRVLSGVRPAPTETGYMVIIGEQLNRDGWLFVGWAPADENGVSDLKMAVQFGYPGELYVLGYRAATPQQVAELKNELKEFQSRPDSDAWYLNDSEAGEILHDYINSPVEDDEDEDDVAKPVKGAKA